MSYKWRIKVSPGLVIIKKIVVINYNKIIGFLIQTAIILFLMTGTSVAKSHEFNIISNNCRNKGKSVVVAVIDSGINYNKYSEIRKHMWSSPKQMHGWDFKKNDESLGIDYSEENDHEYHGTYIASQLIKRKNCIDPFNIKIMDVVYPEHREASSFKFYEFPKSLGSIHREKRILRKYIDEFADYVQWSIDSGAEVINLSSISLIESPKLYNVIKHAQDKNIVFVVSAGNEDRDLDKYPAYPCSFKLDNVICVGALESGVKASYSNYGHDVDVYVNGNHGSFIGTSFSAPIVTNFIVSLKSKNPKIDFLEIKEKTKRKFKVF
jgi:subtilisin family serine protease